MRYLMPVFKTLLFLTLSFPIALHADDTLPTIHIGSEEFPPFASETLSGQGIDCTILREALALEGMNVAFSFMSAARSYEAAKEGMVDATVPWARRPGRDVDFYFSEPLRPADTEAWFVSKKTGLQWNAEKPDFAALHGLTVGIVNGYNYGESFSQGVANGLIKTETVRDTELGLKMLVAGRMDVVISPRLVGIYKMQLVLTERDIASIDVIPLLPHAQGDDYVLISKRSPHAALFRDKLNAALIRFKQTPRYQEILNLSARPATP